MKKLFLGILISMLGWSSVPTLAGDGIRYTFEGTMEWVFDPEGSIPAALGGVTFASGDAVAATATIFDSDIAPDSSDSPIPEATNYFLPLDSGSISASVTTNAGDVSILADLRSVITIHDDNPPVGGDIWAYGQVIDSSPGLFMQVALGDESLARLNDQSYFIETSLDGWPPAAAWAFYDFVGIGEVRTIAIARGHLEITLLTPATLLGELVTTVVDFNLGSGIGNALDRKLENVLNAMDRALAGDEPAAIGITYAFIQSVEAQRGKALSEAQADELVAAAEAIIRTLEAA